MATLEMKTLSVSGKTYEMVDNKSRTDISEINKKLDKQSQLTPEFANSIEDCTDTSKLYILPDGYIYAYKSVTETVKAYTNLADPTSADWAEGNRINSSGALVAQDGFITTNFISVNNGDVVRIKGIDLNTNTYARVGIFNNSKGIVSATKISAMTSAQATDITYDTTGGQFTVITPNPYMRFCGTPNGNPNDIIITINEEIKEETVTSYKWVNTGHAFVPADYEERIIAVEAMAAKNAELSNTLEQKIENLEIGESTSVYPSVWDDAVAECIAKIKALQVGRNCVTFPFFSDNHQRNGYAGALIAKVMSECNIPYCFFGGDTISNGYIDSESTMIEQDRLFDRMMKAVPNGRFCRTVGNHDGYWAVSASEKHTYTREQVYELFLREEAIAQNKHFGDDGTYYYVDDIASKVRFIVLNTNNTTMVAGSEYIDSTQLSWLQNTALSFNENGWAIVFISHHPISNHYHTNISNADEVRTLVSNYINGTSANKADIVGWFSGHIHRDRIYTGVSVNDTDDSEGDAIGFTQVTITSDHTGIAYDDATKHPVGNDNQSHAIDFVTINKANRTVNITRLGIGSDRSYSY